jgi:Na+-transporting methylmalonyl-CoA/oxaloacetate decarboxylase gamma subunit
MTPELLGVLLPLLGFSLVLNVLLFAMLLFRPVSRLVTRHILRPVSQSMSRFVTTYWLGLQLVIRN